MGVHVDEDEAPPATDLDLVEAHVDIGHRGREVGAVHDFLIRSVQFESPGVVPAPDLPGGEVPNTGGQSGAAVWAGVVEGADGVGFAAGHQDRLVTDDVFEKIPHPGDLFFTARHLPHPRPEAVHLQIEEVLGDVAILRDDVLLSGLDQRSVSGNCHDHGPHLPRPPQGRSPSSFQRNRVLLHSQFAGAGDPTNDLVRGTFCRRVGRSGVDQPGRGGGTAPRGAHRTPRGQGPGAADKGVIVVLLGSGTES